MSVLEQCDEVRAELDANHTRFTRSNRQYARSWLNHRKAGCISPFREAHIVRAWLCFRVTYFHNHLGGVQYVLTRVCITNVEFATDHLCRERVDRCIWRSSRGEVFWLSDDLVLGREHARLARIERYAQHPLLTASQTPWRCWGWTVVDLEVIGCTHDVDTRDHHFVGTIGIARGWIGDILEVHVRHRNIQC